jgi:hypothetical protein
MDKAVKQLGSNGLPISGADLKRLSPLRHNHITMEDHYY